MCVCVCVCVRYCMCVRASLKYYVYAGFQCVRSVCSFTAQEAHKIKSTPIRLHGASK